MKSILLIIFLLTIVKIFPQQQEDSLKILTENFKSFEYGNVIQIANKLISSKKDFNKDDLKEIYLMKGIAHYSLQEDDAAERSFINILQIDTSYVLDSSKTSPKIIAFYSDVKENYLERLRLRNQNIVIDTLVVTKVVPDYEMQDRIKYSIARSVVLPGWGHIYNGEKTKGILLTTFSIAALGASVYLWFETNNKESDYLQEKNVPQIADKYDEYNFFYKMRNISILTYAVIWIYSQIDLLFFSDFDKNENPGTSYLPEVNINPLTGINFNYKIHF